ncbi:glycosyltransferase family 39 protein [bacterium]|nr:glycosyltransferase family 39 protein [candidate division CSSED10-310 bacterium]
MLKTTVIITVLILILLFLFIQIHLIFIESYSSDEYAHIYAGARHLFKNDASVNPEHPPLIKLVASLPILFQASTDIIATINTPYYQFEGGWKLVSAMSFPLSLSCRHIILLCNVLIFALVIYQIMRSFGTISGVLGSILLFSNPTLIAHSHFICFDVPSFCFTLLALLYFYRYLDAQIPSHLLGMSISASFALSTKFTALPFFILLGFSIVFSHSRDFKTGNIKPLFHSIFYFLTGLLVLGSLYGWKLLPILNGISNRISILSQPQNTYFLGKLIYSKWYYPVILVCKENLSFMFICLTSLIVILLRYKDQNRTTKLKINTTFVILMLTSFLLVNSRFQVGIRHALTIYPYLYGIVFIAFKIVTEVSSFTKRFKPSRYAAEIFAILLMLDLGRFYIIFPDFIAYSNWCVGNPMNIRHIASDSNVGWGTNYLRLANWIEDAKRRYPELTFHIFNRIGWPGRKVLEIPGVFHDFEVSEILSNQKPSIVILDDFYLQYYTNRPIVQHVLNKGTLIKVIGYDLFIFRVG